MTPSQARQEVLKGKGPKGIDRIDPPHEIGGEWHAHLSPGVGSVAVNQNGTWRHLPAGKTTWPLTKKQKQFLQDAGWQV